jgi:hypothetical protein
LSPVFDRMYATGVHGGICARRDRAALPRLGDRVGLPMNPKGARPSATTEPSDFPHRRPNPSRLSYLSDWWGQDFRPAVRPAGMSIAGWTVSRDTTRR